MAIGGTVKFFNGERGYGFIKPDDGGRDVFVHITAVERAGLKSLVEGQRIGSDVEAGQEGQGPESGRSRRHRLRRRCRVVWEHDASRIPCRPPGRTLIRCIAPCNVIPQKCTCATMRSANTISNVKGVAMMILALRRLRRSAARSALRFRCLASTTT